MSENIKANLVPIPPGGVSTKPGLPASTVLKMCRRLEILNRRHRKLTTQEKRDLLLRQYPDMRDFEKHNPFMFFAFTDPSTTPSKLDVYKRMIEIKVDIEGGTISEQDGYRAMGQLCASYTTS